MTTLQLKTGQVAAVVGIPAKQVQNDVDAGYVQPIVAAQQQQHALRAAETCCSVDQQLVHGPFLAKYVQAQRGIDEAVRAFARA